MKIGEFLENIPNLSIDKEKVELVEKEYGFTIDSQLQGVISNADTSIEFENGGRTLTLDEIVNACEIFNFDFKKLGALPFIISGEDEFMCYDGSGKFYYTFNKSE